jgi:hypothetical protein
MLAFACSSRCGTLGRPFSRGGCTIDTYIHTYIHTYKLAIVCCKSTQPNIARLQFTCPGPGPCPPQTQTQAQTQQTDTNTPTHSPCQPFAHALSDAGVHGQRTWKNDQSLAACPSQNLPYPLLLSLASDWPNFANFANFASPARPSAPTQAISTLPPRNGTALLQPSHPAPCSTCPQLSTSFSLILLLLCKTLNPPLNTLLPYNLALP